MAAIAFIHNAHHWWLYLFISHLAYDKNKEHQQNVSSHTHSATWAPLIINLKRIPPLFIVTISKVFPTKRLLMRSPSLWRNFENPPRPALCAVQKPQHATVGENFHGTLEIMGVLQISTNIT